MVAIAATSFPDAFGYTDWVAAATDRKNLMITVGAAGLEPTTPGFGGHRRRSVAIRSGAKQVKFIGFFTLSLTRRAESNRLITHLGIRRVYGFGGSFRLTTSNAATVKVTVQAVDLRRCFLLLMHQAPRPPNRIAPRDSTAGSRSRPVRARVGPDGPRRPGRTQTESTAQQASSLGERATGPMSGAQAQLDPETRRCLILF